VSDNSDQGNIIPFLQAITAYAQVENPQFERQASKLTDLADQLVSTVGGLKWHDLSRSRSVQEYLFLDYPCCKEQLRDMKQRNKLLLNAARILVALARSQQKYLGQIRVGSLPNFSDPQFADYHGWLGFTDPPSPKENGPAG